MVLPKLFTRLKNIISIEYKNTRIQFINLIYNKILCKDSEVKILVILLSYYTTKISQTQIIKHQHKQIVKILTSMRVRMLWLYNQTTYQKYKHVKDIKSIHNN